MPTMKDLILPTVKSTYVSINRPYDNFSRDIDLEAGWQSPSSAQRILLEFDMSPLGQNADIVSACLRMYASYRKNGWGQLTPYLLTSSWDDEKVTWDSQPPFNRIAYGKTKVETATGWYYWDITQLAQRWIVGENHGLMLVPKENEIPDFTVFDKKHRFCPALLVKYDEFSNFLTCSDGTLSSFEVLHVGDEKRFSSWQNTCSCKLYNFFVENTGPATVRMHVQISPDECTEYDEAAVYDLKKGDTESIVPQRFAYHTRLAITTLEPGGKAKLKIWFQAQT